MNKYFSTGNGRKDWQAAVDETLQGPAPQYEVIAQLSPEEHAWLMRRKAPTVGISTVIRHVIQEAMDDTSAA